jgi:hypothetical protein
MLSSDLTTVSSAGCRMTNRRTRAVSTAEHGEPGREYCHRDYEARPDLESCLPR